jgi:CRP/FNR family transcriptional regulator
MHGVCTRCDICPVRRTSICEVLTNDELSKLLKISRQRFVKAHQPIFHDGDNADQYFNIVRGVVKLVKTLEDGKQHIIGLMYPPDFLGQSLSSHHAFSAEAATDVEICSFQRAPFDALLTEHPKLEHKILEFTLRDLDICRDWTLMLGRKSSYERVASFLYMLAKRSSSPGCKNGGKEPIRFELPFTRAEIGDYLGLAFETVSRQFTQLKERKIIDLPTQREVVIPDIAHLLTVARLEGRLELERAQD